MAICLRLGRYPCSNGSVGCRRDSRAVSVCAIGPYDLDDNERIERGEVIASISDYFKSIIGKDEVIRLIRLYFVG